MRVAIGSDHAGFDLKEAMKAFLADEHHDIVDVGTDGRAAADDADNAHAVGAALRAHRAERGLIICASGVGASIAANRMPGVRAGLCHDTYSAREGVEHDDMNVLVLGGRVVGIEMARELTRAFLSARFTHERRHLRRLAKMTPLENPLRALQMYGQSVWLDHIRHGLIASGELQRLIDEDGLRGLVSNPAFLEKAIAGGSEYTEMLRAADVRVLNPKSLYEKVAIRDAQDTANALRSVYGESSKRDGYVSLEISPFLANDTAGTLNEARRLWQGVGRDNLMIKVPATPEGIAAIQQLIGEGINVNATLLFAQEAYERTAEAYITGLEKLVAHGGDPARVASVASFFLSRVDTAIEAVTAARMEAASDPREYSALRALNGKVAIANARLAYQRYRELFSGPRWQELARRGAQTQRLLWASTSTKHPVYSDVVYVKELIGPDTVTMLAPATLDAFRDHGRPRASLADDLDAARDTMTTLAEAGVSMQEVGDALLADGVRLSSDAFARLLKTVERSRDAGAGRINRMELRLPEPLTAAVKRSLTEWQTEGNVRRLWARDASLWTGRDERRHLGWLGLTTGQAAHIGRLARIADVSRRERFSYALLLGAGGSSLCAEVMRRTFGTIDGFPELHVLDSTDPVQVKAARDAIDPPRTLFIVSSKSGATLEPTILAQYFFDEVERLLGATEAARRFIAITDPGSHIQHVAERDGFRSVFFGWPAIGGRYSAMSDVGLVPAAVMGIDVAKLIERTDEMVCACMPPVPIEENPGVVLGTILGVAAAQFGRDKLTLVASSGIAGLGAWLEQLVAESTGKTGRGLIPVDREALAAPDVYGRDRLFVYLKLASDADAEQERSVEALERAGQPVVRITVDDPYDVGEEFFRWQMAVAVAGAILGVNPFDQPDVEASRTAARTLIAAYEKSGALTAETPIFIDHGVALFTDDKNAATLLRRTNGDRTLETYLQAHLDRISEGDYFALLAYVARTETHERALQAIRDFVRETRRVATCLEFGPRFLHSTGQAHKGGPNTGVFLQITCDDAPDLPVPGQLYTFGVVKAAQARGDFDILLERGRRALRVHLGLDVAAGLARLQTALRAAILNPHAQR